MKTSVRWINDYLDRPAEAREQAEALTAAGFNFDGATTLADGAIQQEIETTSNRGDCLCHLGLARELAAATGRTLKIPSEQPVSHAPAASSFASVVNTDTQGCPRYTARVIRGVKVGPSPEWMQQRLRDVGQVPRNNLVDCTNFVLLEMGQPTHVFDLRKVHGGQIRVRRATEGEAFLPLGEHAQTIKLSSADLVIADAQRPLALAGVKGGADSAVDATTVDVLLEAATFSPTLVRQMSRKHQIISDSSKRFERGVHPASIDTAANRLALLIMQCAGGALCEGVLEAGAPMPVPRSVSMRPARCRALLGIQLTDAEIIKPLTALGFAPRVQGETLLCTVPSQRMDIEREVDLIEEVIRLLGTDRLPIGDVIRIRTASPDSPTIALERTKDLLAGLGFVECVTHALIGERLAQSLLTAGHRALRVDDDRAGGTPCLRPAALAGPLVSRTLNADRGVMSGVKMFEIAHAFDIAANPSADNNGAHREWLALGLLADAPNDSDGYRAMRGVLDRLAHEIGGCVFTMQPAHPGAGMRIAATVLLHGTDIGRVGLLDSAAAASVGLEIPVAVAEILLQPLLSRFPPERPATPLPAFPSAERDISLVVAESMPWRTIEQSIRGANLAHLESIAFVGVYRGQQVGADRKSVTLRMVFRKPEGTNPKESSLRGEDVDAAVKALTTLLHQSLGAELRV